MKISHAEEAGESQHPVVIAIAAGKEHSLTLQSDGTVHAYGNNDDGQCDVSNVVDRVVAIACGGHHSLALMSDRTITGWGGNLFRQTETPVGLDDVEEVVAGHWHSVALRHSGEVVAWGRNSARQSTVPEGLGPVTAIAAGYEHTIALKGDGTVVAWGSNDKGQCNVPDGLTDVTAIAAGGWQGFALRRDGSLVAWGEGGGGATDVGAYSHISALSGGYWHGLALQKDGHVVAWGDNEFGQAAVPWGLSDVVAIDAGGEHSIALKSDGTVVAWGRNDRSQAQTNVLASPSESARGVSDAQDPAQAEHVARSQSLGTVWGWGSTDHGLMGELPQLSSAVPEQIPGIDRATQIVVQGATVYALDDDGHLWGWGGNSRGELGDGTTVDRYLPVDVASFSGVSSVIEGLLAVKKDGTVWSWVDSTNGLPTQMHPGVLKDVVSVAHDGKTYFAVRRNGTVWSWGRNQYGQLGNGTISSYGKTDADAESPVQVSLLIAKRSWLGKSIDVVKPLAGVVSVLASDESVWALKSDGTVWAWGLNGRGQLGDGTRQSQARPTRIATLTGVHALSREAGWTYAISKDGKAWHWRSLTNQEIEVSAAGIPEQIQGLGEVRYLSTGEGWVSAVSHDEGVRHWKPGDRFWGEPTLVDGIRDPAVIVSGEKCIALAKDGTVWSWGHTPVESGGWTYSRTAIQVAGLHHVKSVSGARGSAFAVTEIGAVWSWGSGARGQLGCGDIRHKLLPEPISSIIDVNAIFAGGGTGFAVTSRGRITAWGANENNKLALDDAEWRDASAVREGVFGVKDVAKVASGFTFVLALTEEGIVWESGRGSGDESRPDRVRGVVDALAIAAGRSTKYVLKRDGTVWAWGSSERNQIGDGTILFPGSSVSGFVTERILPVAALVPRGMVEIAAGANSAYALHADGTVWSWGDNEFGQLGNGDRRRISSPEDQNLRPTPVKGLAGVRSIAAGESTAYAALDDGSVWAWGLNDCGQLGNGSSAEANALPTRVRDLAGVRSIVTSGKSSFALTSDGAVWSWGSNRSGQLGDGTKLDRVVPVRVEALSGVLSMACAGDASFALALGQMGN